MMTGITVRPLRAADLEPARWVIFRAYLEVLLQLYGPAAASQYAVRSPAFMALYLRRDAHGCFAAAAGDGTIVGAVFCFAWGEVGWFGSLAVAPEWQGRGVGQALTGRAVAYLEARGCRRIGLETWPESPAVHHLYSKFGFGPCRPTIKLARAAAEAAPGAGWTPRWTPAGEAARLAGALEGARRVQAALHAAAPDEPRADYGAEIAAAVEAGFADLLLLRGPDGDPAAFALCYVRQPSGDPVSALDVRLLAAVPGQREAAALDAAVAACDGRAAALGLERVTYDVNLRHARAAALLRARGFRPVYELLRMERPLAGFDPMARTPLIDCARWAG
jgi:ribosomal protein S18 acetylase RimI-like enzyme